MVVAPHKKGKQVRTNKQALSEIARRLNAAVVAQSKRFERQLKANEEREQQRLEFREREAERDRNHEYRMAQLFLMYNRNINPQNQLSERSADDSSSMYPDWGVDQLQKEP